MEMMNRAIEDASDFKGMMHKVTAGERDMLNALRSHDDAPDEAGNDRRFSVVSDRRPGENRAAHRARLKRERSKTRGPLAPTHPGDRLSTALEEYDHR